MRGSYDHRSRYRDRRECCCACSCAARRSYPSFRSAQPSRSQCRRLQPREACSRTLAKGICVKLKPYAPAPPPPPEVCACCQAFAPDCLLPIGEGCVPACWLCAHAVAEHGCAPGDAMTHECECDPNEIYPARREDLRKRRRAESDARALPVKLAALRSARGGLPGSADAEPTKDMESDPDGIDTIVLRRNASDLVLAESRGDAPTSRRSPRVARRRLR